jgi:hypothetical protein
MFTRKVTAPVVARIIAARHGNPRALRSVLRAARVAALVACMMLLVPGLAGLPVGTARADGASITDLHTTFTATAGMPFSGTIASFEDSNLSDTTHTLGIIEVLWNGANDLSTSAMLTGGNGTFTVQGSHTYAVPGSYTVNVELERIDGNTTTFLPLSSTAVVSACAPANTAPSAYAQAVLADKPLGYWRLDETAGSACLADSSGHALSGTASAGGLTFGEPGAPLGDDDTALAFDGQSGYVSLGDPASLQPNQLSVEAWINTTHPGGIIVRKRLYGYDLALTGAGQPTFGIDDINAVSYTATGPASVADGKWHYLVGTYNGGQVCLYVDGTQAACQPAAAIYYQPDAIAIGRDGGAADAYFNGAIDDVAIYGTALSAAQVQAHYSAASKLMSTTTLTMTPNPAVVGQAYSFTATVHGAGSTPTGTVNFCFLYQGHSYCTPEPLNGNGIATEAFTALQNSEAAPGSYTETAVFQGDATHAVSTSAPISEVINKAQTSVTLVSSANPAAIGQTVTFTAAVQVLAPGSGFPTGTVTFKDGSTVLGTAAIGLPLRVSTSSLAVGSHTITAVYSGDTQFIGSTSSALPQVVTAATSLFTTQTPTATYGGAFELGVRFKSSVAGTLIGLRYYRVAGETGTHSGHLWSVTGTMLGTVNFASETASGWQYALFASPVAISANTIYVASVNSHTFFGYTPAGLSNTIANGPLSTQGGVYSGTVGAFPSTSNTNNYFSDVLFQSSATTTSLSSAVNPSIVGQTATFTASVQTAIPGSGVPTGTVTFKDGATTLGTGTLTASGVATYSTSSLAVGIHSIIAVYGGDAHFTASTSSALSQVVTAATSLFTTQTPTATYGGAFELGVRFKSSAAGTLIGLRYYRVAGETGTHGGHLWNATGTLLGTVTFTNETASGWQYALFASPVAISANTIYVASVDSHTLFGYTAGGLSSATRGAQVAGPFALTASAPSAAVSNGPLSSMGGVYSGTVGAFPTTPTTNNYFRDVLFTAQ